MGIALRLEEIAKDEGLSMRAFELSIGKTSGYINMMKRNNGSPSADVLQKIIEIYSKYNLYWILGISNEKFSYEFQKADRIQEESELYGKEIIHADFLGLSKRIDKVIDQNSEILDKLNRSILKDNLKEEEKRLSNNRKSVM